MIEYLIPYKSNMKLLIFSASVTIFFFITNVANSREIIVDQNHKKASDIRGDGTLRRPYLTISMAAELARAGDTVLVYGGIYREWVAPKHSGQQGSPVVYSVAPNERVVVKGSEVWKNDWISLKDNVYKSVLDTVELGSYNPFYIPLARTEGRQSLGQIFVNSERYIQVDSLEVLERSPGTWMLSYDSTDILLHFDPNKSRYSLSKSLIEYSARERIFSPHKRGLSYINVEGFIFEHAANQFPSGFYRKGPKGHPQAGAVSTRAGSHFIIRNNVIRYAKSLGIDCGYGGSNDIPESEEGADNRDDLGYHIIEYNSIQDCGVGGIAGAGQRESLIRFNLIEGCNYLNIAAPETGAIKVHWFNDGVIEGNIIRNNNCNGIWLDNIWNGSRVTRNVILNSVGQGIFIELGYGDCIVDNNIIAFTRQGDGIYLHDASGVTIAHNLLFANQHFGVYARIVTERTTRNPAGEKELVGTKDLKITNNIFVDNYRGQICLPPDDGNRVQNNLSDHNLFIGGTQWQWEGLRYNTFTLGWNDKRVHPDTLAILLHKALLDHHVPDSLQPNYLLWKNQPILDLEWWRMLTGKDLHSYAPEIHTGEIEVGAIAKGAFYLSPSNLFIEIRNGQSFNQLKVTSIPGIDNDFYGNTYLSKMVLPGPFQNYTKGYNKFQIIPN